MALTTTPIELSSTPSIVDGGNATAITIDSSENVTLAGTLTAGDGHTFGSDGDDNLLIASSANENIIIDSAVDIILDTDNNSIKFKDNGTQFGSLGASAGLFVAGTACGIRLHSGGTKIFPTTSSGGANDDAVDLGAVGGAWKEVYAKRFITDGDGIKMASGMGIKFDAYGSGNVLDDYEEGSWTPAIVANSGTQPTVTFASGYVVQGYYTKVGRLVNVTFYIPNFTVTGTTSGTLLISGLPFASGSSTGSANGNVLSHYNITFARGSNGSIALRHYDTTNLGILTVDNGATWGWEAVSCLSGGSARYLTGSISYQANS